MVEKIKEEDSNCKNKNLKNHKKVEKALKHKESLKTNLNISAG